MKAIVLFIVLLLNNSIYAQTQPDIKDKNWFLTKLEIDNQVYNRPVNAEAAIKAPNFYIQSTTNINGWMGFCYVYQMEVFLNEQSQILYLYSLSTLAVPQECNLQGNNHFDQLNLLFWIEKTDTTRDIYVNPLQFDYDVIGSGNTLELIITNEIGNKAYYNDVTASTDIFKKLPVKVYPNPVQSVLNIDLPVADYQNVLIDIYDVTGKKLKSFKENWQENISLNIESLPAGNYLLELKLPNEPGRGHFVKIIKE